MLLYSIGIWLYRQGVRVVALSGGKASLLHRGLKNAIPYLKKRIIKGERYIWIHAASLGEFEQGRPLMEMIRRERPELKILLTFFSPSGYEIRKNFAGADAVCYLPMDTPQNVCKFLDIVDPEIAIFIKYEFWGNYLSELSRRSIATYLISGIFRKEQLFFKPYGSFYRKWLGYFTHLFLQDEGSRHLLEGIGLNNVTVAGDTRFDRVTDIMRTVHTIAELERFCGSRDLPDRLPVLMCGSSWPEDEAVYSDWVLRHPEIKTVIAPHEFDTRRIEALKRLFGEDITVSYSELKSGNENIEGKRVLIMDCFGLLSSAYAYADIVFVGGGFGAGLHNINEAAVYGVPVIYGPNYHKFIEAEEMRILGGGLPVSGKKSFERVADRLLYDSDERTQRGRWSAEYISEKTGATPRIFNAILDSDKG